MPYQTVPHHVPVVQIAECDTIDAREEKDYVPTKAPDVTGRIGIAWRESIRSLKVAGQFFFIVTVAFVPWIIPVSVVVGGLFLLSLEPFVFSQ